MKLWVPYTAAYGRADLAEPFGYGRNALPVDLLILILSRQGVMQPANKFAIFVKI